jgi:uncharacterized protein (TIGR03067 family)
MRHLIPLPVILAFVAVHASGDDKSDPAAAKEMKALAGSWKVVKAQLGGADITDQLKKLTFEVAEDGKYTASHDQEKDEGAFTVDLKKRPKVMAMKPTGGPLKDKDVKAIYRLDGDTLLVCFDHENPETAPAKFESRPGTTLLLINYRREKKK